MADFEPRELKIKLQAIIAKLQRILDAVEELSEDEISTLGALLGVVSAKPAAKKPRKKPKGLGEYIRTGDHSRLMELTASIRHHERGHKEASPEEYEAWKRERDEIKKRLKKDSMERRKAAREARKQARHREQQHVKRGAADAASTEQLEQLLQEDMEKGSLVQSPVDLVEFAQRHGYEIGVAQARKIMDGVAGNRKQ